MGRTVGCRVPGTIARIAGAELTHPLDCNVYVVYGREEALLVDTGVGRAPLEIPSEVTTVIVTHLHADHSAGAAALGRAGLRVRAHPWTADGLMAGDEERAGLDRARRWGCTQATNGLSPARRSSRSMMAPASISEAASSRSSRLRAIHRGTSRSRSKARSAGDRSLPVIWFSRRYDLAPGDA